MITNEILDSYVFVVDRTIRMVSRTVRMVYRLVGPNPEKWDSCELSISLTYYQIKGCKHVSLRKLLLRNLPSMTPMRYRVRLSLTVPAPPHVFGPIGMAAVLTKCSSITDEVFLETSRLLAALTPAEGLAHGRLFPAFSDLKVR